MSGSLTPARVWRLRIVSREAEAVDGLPVVPELERLPVTLVAVDGLLYDTVGCTGTPVTTPVLLRLL